MPKPKRLPIGDGQHALGDDAGGRATALALLAAAKRYRFCHPVAEGGDGRPLPLRFAITTDEARALATIQDLRQHAFWDEHVRREARRAQVAVTGLFIGRSTEPGSAPDQDFSRRYLLELGDHLVSAYEAEAIPRDFRGFFTLYLSEVLIAEAFAPGRGILPAIAAVFRAGYFPIRWVGVYPAGHLEVYCPPDRPQAATAPIDQGAVEEAERRERTALIAAAARDYRAHPGFADAAPTSDDHRPAWKRLVARGDAAAVREHFKPLVTSAADRAALATLAARLKRVAVSGSRLVFFLKDEADEVLALRCQPPWTGALTHVPRDLIGLLRLHNGMLLDEPSETPEVFPFDGKGFRIGKGVLEDMRKNHLLVDPPWTAAPPLLPMTNGADFYVYHPTIPDDDGRARLLRVSHEVAKLREGAGTGAGGLFLHLVAARLAVG